MKTIINFLITISLLIFISGCGPTWRAKHSKNNETIIGSSMKGVEFVYNRYQIDSMCTVDTLSSFNNWIKTSFTDYETNKQIEKKMFIKDISSDHEKIYTSLQYQDTLFLISIRVVENK